MAVPELRSPAGSPSGSPAADPARMVLLLSVMLAINYVDRGNLATAVPLIRAELHLRGWQLGLLISAFFYPYVLVMAPVGSLAERYGATRVLSVGVGLWGVATLLTGFAGGFVGLLLLRLLLGLGESAAFPCSSKLVAGTLEPPRLALANGWMAFGYLIGPGIGTLFGGLAMARFGWRAVFVSLGAASLVWLLPWARLRTPPLLAATAAAAAPSWGEILRQRGLWGASLGHFASNYSWYFVLAWLPDYLVSARGFSLQAMAVVSGSAYLINAGAALASGWFTARFLAAGGHANTIYKAIMALNHLTSIAVVAGIALLPLGPALACLYIFEIVVGISSPGTFAIAQTMAGSTAAGRWVGVQNTCANVAGMIAPVLSGLLLDLTGHLDSAFVLASLVNLLGLIGWVVILPRVQPVIWRSGPALARRTMPR